MTALHALCYSPPLHTCQHIQAGTDGACGPQAYTWVGRGTHACSAHVCCRYQWVHGGMLHPCDVGLVYVHLSPHQVYLCVSVHTRSLLSRPVPDCAGQVSVALLVSIAYVRRQTCPLGSPASQ